MPLLPAIVIACLAGGVLSVLLAAAVAFRARPAWIPTLVSFAVGTLLGAVFIEVIPHVFEQARDIRTAALSILGGIMLFFILEKLVLWRHDHDHDFSGAAPVEHDHGRSGLMIMVGDTFHNFVDGVIIAAAFISDFNLGVITALAIIAHEVPQEIGDFVILLHSGYSKRMALWLNVLSSFATVLGALLAYFALRETQGWVPVMLGIAAASMIYVAVADLIPGLHKRTSLAATLQQVSLIAAGVGVIWILHATLGA